MKPAESFSVLSSLLLFFLHEPLPDRSRLCRANLHKWGLGQSPSSDCGQRQAMNHIVDMGPLTKSERGLNLLHEADDDAVIWLESTATAALAK